MNRNSSEYFTGCLLGGAVGDAVGWPVEFADISEIIGRFGPDGITNMVPGAGGIYEITDDTQMTLFTAEGLLQAWTMACLSGEAPDFAATVKNSYLCWLSTQGEYEVKNVCTGWLLGIEGLHQRRAPGDTCLSALREGALLENSFAENNSKGCGGIMRAAPAGLLAARIITHDIDSSARLAFDIGCATARITHAHPSGYLPAGVLAAVIAAIITGGSLEDAISISLDILSGRNGADETVAAVQNAVNLWQNKGVMPSPKAIEVLGKGWSGEEALAIGLYCALVAGSDFIRGVRLAVNHSGDSDSTGSITGNILGAKLGEQAIPCYCLNQLELGDVVRQVGRDLFTAFEETREWLESYPPLKY